MELSSEIEEELSAPVSAMYTGPGPEAMLAARSALKIGDESTLGSTMRPHVTSDAVCARVAPRDGTRRCEGVSVYMTSLTSSVSVYDIIDT